MMDAPDKKPDDATPAGTGHATKEDIRKRVDDVLRIMLDGARYHDVVQYSAENGWNVRERQLRQYMARARKLMAVDQRAKRRTLMVEHIAQRHQLFARAISTGDLRSALAILDSLAKLQALFPDPAGDLKREVEALRNELAEAEQARRAAANLDTIQGEEP